MNNSKIISIIRGAAPGWTVITTASWEDPRWHGDIQAPTINHVLIRDTDSAQVPIGGNDPCPDDHCTNGEYHP